MSNHVAAFRGADERLSVGQIFLGMVKMVVPALVLLILAFTFLFGRLLLEWTDNA